MAAREPSVTSTMPRFWKLRSVDFARTPPEKDCEKEARPPPALRWDACTASQAMPPRKRAPADENGRPLWQLAPQAPVQKR